LDIQENFCGSILKMVHFANIMADCSHAFGRCGLGAVMGSKNLKGVVVKGSQRRQPPIMNKSWP
jgi:aldehyde:ferredoxin oxidoreductase